MIAASTLQIDNILWKAAGTGRSTGHSPLCSKLGLKASFSVYLRLFNKSILKQQYAKNPGKSAELEVSELLKL